MNYYVDVITKIGLLQLLLGIVVLALVLKIVFEVYDYFKSRLGIKTAKEIEHEEYEKRQSNQEKQMNDFMESTNNQLNEFSICLTKIIEEMSEMKENVKVEIDGIRADSKAYREKQRESQLTDKQYKLIATWKDSTNKGYISQIDKLTFNRLLSEYEELGGNGFMHTVVVPDIESLRVEIK